VPADFVCNALCGVAVAGLAFASAMLGGIVITLAAVALAAVLARQGVRHILTRYGGSIERLARALDGLSGVLTSRNRHCRVVADDAELIRCYDAVTIGTGRRCRVWRICVWSTFSQFTTVSTTGSTIERGFFRSQ
jgi:hypothetical protein